MNSKDLEEKLEKDNITLKEHILKLQQTIKHIKSEMMTGDSREENNSVFKKQNDSLHKASKPINKSINNHTEKYQNQQINLNEEDDDHLKFSFNVKNGKKSEKRENSKEKVKEEKSKTNIYRDNFNKLRKENDILDKTEKLKKESNLIKKYSDSNQEEIIKFQKNIRNNYVNDMNQKNKKNFSNKESEDERELNEDLRSNNLNLDDLRVEAGEEKLKLYNKQNIEKNPHTDERASIKSYKQKEKIPKASSIKETNGNYSNYKKENSNDRRRSIQLKEELQADDFQTQNQKFVNQENNIRKTENYYNKDNDSYSVSFDDSFENKVKTLQQDKGSKLRSDMKNNSLMHNKNSLNNNFISNKSKTLDSKKRSVSKTRYITIDKTAEGGVKKLNRNDSIKKLNTIGTHPKSKQKNNSIIDYYGNSCHVGYNGNNESSLRNEVSSLKREMAKMKIENKKIKELYEKEKDRNQMYKDFSDELIKNYE